MSDRTDGPPAAWSRVDLDAAIDALELSASSRAALAGAGASTVRTVLDLELPELAAQEAVGEESLRQLTQLLDVLLARFSDAPPRRGDVRHSLDDLLAELFPPAWERGTRSFRTVRWLLGLPDQGVSCPVVPWPSQVDVADALAITSSWVGMVLRPVRHDWLRLDSLAAMRDEIRDLLNRWGGVMAVGTLAAAVLDARGSRCLAAERRRRAFAVVRAALEAERVDREPRFTNYWQRPIFHVAVAGEVGLKLARYASALARTAERLGKRVPLPRPELAIRALCRLRQPAGVDPLQSERILRQALAALDVAKPRR